MEFLLAPTKHVWSFAGGCNCEDINSNKPSFVGDDYICNNLEYFWRRENSRTFTRTLIYNVLWTFNIMYSNAVNVLPAGYIILQFSKNCFTFYLLIYNAQLYFMFMKITL